MSEFAKESTRTQSLTNEFAATTFHTEKTTKILIQDGDHSQHFSVENS